MPVGVMRSIRASFEVALCFRLGSEMLLRTPFLQQFLGEGIPVGPAFGIEARAGIAVPTPGAVDAGAGLKHPNCEPEPTQLVELLETGHAGVNHDSVRTPGRTALPQHVQPRPWLGARQHS